MSRTADSSLPLGPAPSPIPSVSRDMPDLGYRAYVLESKLRLCAGVIDQDAVEHFEAVGVLLGECLKDVNAFRQELNSLRERFDAMCSSASTGSLRLVIQ